MPPSVPLQQPLECIPLPPILVTPELSHQVHLAEDNPKKCRRKCFSRCRTFRRSNSDSGTDTSNSNSSNSNNPSNQCPFSKLKNSFRQNLISWTSSTQPQSPHASTSTDTNANDERKSCKFRKSMQDEINAKQQ